MTSRAWEALVEEGVRRRQADSPDRRWALGDLCLEAVPPGKTREERSATQRRLLDFAAATGLSLSLLKDCHRTAEKWPVGMRLAGISHARHSKYASRPNRIRLLLNDESDDGLTNQVRSKVEKVEELLDEPAVRTAVLERARARNRRFIAAVKAVDDEELTQARHNQRVAEEHARAQLAAPSILARMGERAVKGDAALTRMIAEILDLKQVIDQMPPPYDGRMRENLTRIQRAAQQALDKLRPATRSPQPRDVIPTRVIDQSGAEHR